MRALLLHITAMLWLFVLALVGGRFVALLLNANDDSEIIARIYRHSEFWVKPFLGAFDLTDPSLPFAGTVEPASLIAFVVYFVGGLFILGLLGSAWRHARRLKAN